MPYECGARRVVNGLVSLRSGKPFTLGTRNCVGQFANCQPDLVSGQDPKNAPTNGRSPGLYFDTSAVTAPRPGTPGSLGLQSNNAPPQKNLDLSVFKDFRITERTRVQFRAESFNLTNTPFFDVGGIGRVQGDPFRPDRPDDYRYGEALAVRASPGFNLPSRGVGIESYSPFLTYCP